MKCEILNTFFFAKGAGDEKYPRLSSGWGRRWAHSQFITNYCSLRGPLFRPLTTLRCMLWLRRISRGSCPLIPPPVGKREMRRHKSTCRSCHGSHALDCASLRVLPYTEPVARMLTATHPPAEALQLETYSAVSFSPTQTNKKAAEQGTGWWVTYAVGTVQLVRRVASRHLPRRI